MEKDGFNKQLIETLPELADDLTDYFLEGSETKESRASLEELLPVVYQELRSLASRQLRRNHNPTLDTTALVNEAYIRIMESRQNDFANRRHFFYFAARTMRFLLVEHARKRFSLKRGGAVAHVPLEDAFHLSGDMNLDIPDLIALGDSLAKLEKLDQRQCRIIEMRFFAGLTNEEIADILDLSSRTIAREWTMAKKWLSRELSRIEDTQ